MFTLHPALKLQFYWKFNNAIFPLATIAIFDFLLKLLMWGNECSLTRVSAQIKFHWGGLGHAPLESDGQDPRSQARWTFIVPCIVICICIMYAIYYTPDKRIINAKINMFKKMIFIIFRSFYNQYCPNPWAFKWVGSGFPFETGWLDQGSSGNVGPDPDSNSSIVNGSGMDTVIRAQILPAGHP